MLLWPEPPAIGTATVLALLVATARLGGAEFRIDRIERFTGNQVTIHFDTVANRTYTLQYLAGLNSTNTNALASGTWSNLYVAPSLPFINHYVVVDSATNRQRIYRLRVTP